MLPVVAFALFFGAIGGGVFMMTREPLKAVEAQMQEIRDGRMDAAYARLSTAHRARLSQADFARLVEKHPALKDNAGMSFWSRAFENSEMRMSGTLTARSGAREKVEYELTKEAGEWKIAVLRFPDE